MKIVPRPLSPLFFALLLSGTACFAQAATSPEPSQAVLGDGKSASFIVRLSSEPSPPVRGRAMMEALVTDLAGKPVNDAQVYFDLDMTNMHHGTNVVAAAPQGDGRYAGQVRFMMPGPWRVIVQIAVPGRAAEGMRIEFKVNSK
jgi:hypothetical protein